MENAESKNFVVWFKGAQNRYGFSALNREDAIKQFAALNRCGVSSYISARMASRTGDYCLLSGGSYGMLHN